MDVAHTANWVADLDRSRAFYVDGLGPSVTRTFEYDGSENLFVGGEHGELQLRYDPDRPAPDPDRSGHDHVGLSVDDVDAAFERLVERTGCPVVHAPFDVASAGSRVAFVEDPDGYVLELVQAVG